MDFINLLGSLQSGHGLDAFAKTFFDAAGVGKFEERESSNYLEGRYFKGNDGDLFFTISLSDEEAHSDLPYWVQISSRAVEGDKLISMVNSLVSGRILPRGFRLSRIVNLGKRNERRLDY
jgi:hypothetical protein